MYIFIKSSFPKPDFQNGHWQTRFFGLALIAFWKRALHILKAHIIMSMCMSCSGKTYSVMLVIGFMYIGHLLIGYSLDY